MVIANGKLEWWRGAAIEVVIRELEATDNPMETAERWIATLGSVSSAEEIEAISRTPEFKWLPKYLPESRSDWTEAVRSLALALLLIVSWYFFGNAVKPLEPQAIAAVVQESSNLNRFVTDVTEIIRIVWTTADPVNYLELIKSELEKIKTPSDLPSVFAVLPWLKKICPQVLAELYPWIKEVLAIIAAEKMLEWSSKRREAKAGGHPTTKEITEIVLTVIEEREKQKHQPKK